MYVTDGPVGATAARSNVKIVSSGIAFTRAGTMLKPIPFVT